MVVVPALLIGVLHVLVNSFVPDRHRRPFNAVMVGGAGAAYLSGGGLGAWEFAITAVITFCAYRGLSSWAWIGIGWLVHTAADVAHHVHGSPIVPFAEHSSLGCAICDPVIALWAFAGGPGIRSMTPAALVRALRLRRAQHAADRGLHQ